jgi:hypothetical protein
MKDKEGKFWRAGRKIGGTRRGCDGGKGASRGRDEGRTGSDGWSRIKRGRRQNWCGRRKREAGEKIRRRQERGEEISGLKKKKPFMTSIPLLILVLGGVDLVSTSSLAASPVELNVSHKLKLGRLGRLGRLRKLF